MMFEEFKLDKRDKYFLVFLILFSTILVIHYIYYNLKTGVTCSDVYVYLVNALYYTGINRCAAENIFLSPTVCFLTSILFRLGLVDTVAIYIVTGVLAIIGNIGLYFLLRRYFNKIYSLTGVIVYSTLSLNLVWLANGTLDIPAVSFTIWLILFGIIAIDDNPKYYIYASLIFVLGFFTRYSIVLTLPPLILYYIHQKGFKIHEEDKKHIKKAFIIGAVIGIIILAVVVAMGHGRFWAGQQMINRAAGESGFYSDPAFNPSLTYYLEKLPNFISNSNTIYGINPIIKNPTILSWAVIAIMVVGAGVWVMNNTTNLKRIEKLPIILLILSVLIVPNVSPLITIFMVMLAFYYIGKYSKHKIGILMMMWLLSNLIFYSNYNIKVSRYIIPAMPAVIFFLMKAVDNIKINFKINKNVIPIILIVLFAIQGFAFTLTYEQTDRYNSHQEIIDYIHELNPDNPDVKIAVSNQRAYLWLYGDNAMGLVSRNQSAIDQADISYYISSSRLYELQNFTEIRVFNGLYLYERNNV